MYRERDLIDACIRQERLAQKQLYEQFSGKMLVTAMRYMRSRADAEDVLQDSFIKVFKHIGSFRFDCPLDAWIRRIVVNTALKQLRTQPDFSQQIDSDLVSDKIEQSELTLSGFQFEQLMAMVNSLPDGCRAVFNLFAIEGYQHSEIAEMLGISEGTSKSQYFRAKNLLQAKVLKEKMIEKVANP
jgi:RNA polymerase sigma factor (sigma-70 family)